MATPSTPRPRASRPPGHPLERGGAGDRDHDLPHHRGSGGGRRPAGLPAGAGPDAWRARVDVAEVSTSRDSITLDGPTGRSTMGLRPASLIRVLPGVRRSRAVPSRAEGGSEPPALTVVKQSFAFSQVGLDISERLALLCRIAGHQSPPGRTRTRPMFDHRWLPPSDAQIVARGWRTPRTQTPRVPERKPKPPNRREKG